MATFLTAYKTSRYATDPVLWAWLTAGQTVRDEDVDDLELRDEIAEGGGSIWYCKECEGVFSPNRPCACFGDECTCADCSTPKFEPPTKEELLALSAEDQAYEAEERREYATDEVARVRVRY